MIALCLLMLCLIFLSNKKIITFRIARRLIVGATILTVIPACSNVIWSFAVGLTVYLSIMMYWIFGVNEKVHKQKENEDKETS